MAGFVARVRGTQGYAENAAEFVQRYEALDFATKLSRAARDRPVSCDRPADGVALLRSTGTLALGETSAVHADRPSRAPA